MKRFEDLPVWKDGRVLTRRIDQTTRQGAFAGDRGLCDQLQRAAVSIVSNIAEGHERGSTPDLIQFLFYAKGSAGEVRAQLYVAEDLGYVRPTEAEELRTMAAGIARALWAWIASMQAGDFRRGPQHQSRPSRAEARWQQLVRDYRLVRMPNGSFAERECQTEDGRTEDGRTEDGKI